MTSLKSYPSIISINVNGLNAPIRRHGFADRIKRHDPSICCLQETHLEPKDTSRLKVKEWRPMDLKRKLGQQFSYQTDQILNYRQSQRYRRTLYYSKRMYPTSGYDNYKYLCPQQGSSQIHKELLTRIKRHIDDNALIGGDHNSPLSAIDDLSRKSTKKEELLMPYQMSWTSQIFTEHYTSELKNTHSVLMPMEHSQEQTMFWDTKRVSTNAKRLKLSPAYTRLQRSEIGTQPQGKTWKKLKHFETNNHPTQE